MSHPAGYLQIPREAWPAIPLESRIIIIDTSTHDPTYLKSIQDTPTGLFLITDVNPVGKRKKPQPKKISADSITELWKYIPEPCQMELLMMMDVISEHQQDHTTVAGVVSTVDSLTPAVASLQARLATAENNLTGTRRQVAALNDDLADARRDLAEMRRQMESLARIIGRTTPVENPPEFGAQFPQRAAQRTAMRRPSVTDRMFVPDDPR